MTNYSPEVVTLFSVYRGFRRLYVPRRPRLDLNEAQHLFVPADQVNFPVMASRAVISCDHYISASPQIEIGVFLSAPASSQMSGTFGIAVGGDPVNRPKSQLREAAREHWSRLQAHTANSL
jgi:hypothetical protein